MIYTISFFKLEISQRDWDSFFAKIWKHDRRFDLIIKKTGRLIQFFVDSDKELTLLNNTLYPFCLAKNKKKNNDSKTIKTPVFTAQNKALLGFLEKEEINNRKVLSLVLKISKYKLNNRFFVLREIYTSGMTTVSKLVMTALPQSLFLTFNLSNSINIEVEKVKPRLAYKEEGLLLSEKGIIESEEFFDNQKLSTKGFDFSKHSFVVGQSGSGKSVFLDLLVEDIYKNYGDDYSIVLVDPHDDVSQNINKKIPMRMVDMNRENVGLFGSSSSPKLSAEMACDLFSTVAPIKENNGLLRLLKFSLTFLYEIDEISFANLKKLLTDSLWRKDKLKKTENRQILDYFEMEYQSIHSSQYSQIVLPLLNLIAEVDFIEKEGERIKIEEMINNNFLTVVPLLRNNFGDKAVRVIGGLIIQQIFTLAQEKKFKKNVILVIDEMSVVQNPSLAHILSESRKFGLSLVMAQQYLSQILPELVQSIMTNTINYFVFRINREDAEIIVRNLGLEIEDYFLKNKNDPRETAELGTKIITDLNPQEMVVRIMSNNKFCLPFKGRTIDL